MCAGGNLDIVLSLSQKNSRPLEHRFFEKTLIITSYMAPTVHSVYNFFLLPLVTLAAAAFYIETIPTIQATIGYSLLTATELYQDTSSNLPSDFSKTHHNYSTNTWTSHT